MISKRWIRSKGTGEPLSDRLAEVVEDPEKLHQLIVVLVTAGLDAGSLRDEDLRGIVLEGVEYTQVVK